MLSLKKEVVKKEVNGEVKHYTNYYIELELNNRVLSVAVEPKHFGQPWDSPQVRKSYTILDVISEFFKNNVDEGDNPFE